jgi:hypothetical protein
MAGKLCHGGHHSEMPYPFQVCGRKVEVLTLYDLVRDKVLAL